MTATQEDLASRNGGSHYHEADSELIDAPTWPTLQNAARQGNAGRILRLVEESTEAHPAAILADLLATFGVWVGEGPHMVVANEQARPLVWPLIIGGTTTGAKGTSRTLVQRIFGAATDGRLHPASGLSSGEGLIEMVRDPRGKPEDRDYDEGVQDKRLLLFEPEFALVLARMRREGSTLGTTLRQVWDGDPLGLINRSRVSAATHHIGIVAHITPKELLAKLDAAELSGGTINRFLPVLSRRVRSLPQGGNLTPDALLRAAGMVRDAVRAVQCREYRRTPSADALWAERYDRLTVGLGDSREGEATARARPQVLRLALIYALLDGKPVLDHEHLAAALALWDYVLGSALYVFADPGRRKADEQLPKLHEFIAQAGRLGRTKTDIMTLHFHRHLKARDVDALLRRLLGDQKIAQREEPTAGRNRVVFTALN